MKKNITKLLLSVLLTVMILPVTTRSIFADVAGSGTKADPWQIGTEGNEDSVTAYKENGTLYVEGSGAIADFDSGLWYHSNDITSVVISEGVTSIGKNAFEGISLAEEITIPEGVTKIGERAFQHCSKITNIVIPSTVSEIEDAAFNNCTILAKVILEPSTPPTLPEDASAVFGYCSNSLVLQVKGASVATYREAAGWSSYSDKIKPATDTIKDILDLADGGFPTSSSGAPSNAWISSTGSKAYKTSSNIVFAYGSSNLTVELSNNVSADDDDNYVYQSGGTTITFVVDYYVLESIEVSTTDSNLNGAYYGGDSVASALFKTEKAFPTTAEAAWRNTSDADSCLYVSEGYIVFFSANSPVPIVPICSRLDNENKVEIEGVIEVSFNITSGKLTSITISGLPDDFGYGDGEYKAVEIITIKSILPSDFPTTKALGWLKEGDANGNRSYLDGTSFKIANSSIPIDEVLTKDGNNYKYSSGGATYTFNMESNALKSITFTAFSSASGEYTPYKYTIVPASKPVGYSENVVFETNGMYSEDTDVVVKVDGTALTLNTDYTVEHGSIKVTLLGSYIKNLTPKTYTISIGVPGSYGEITSQLTITGSTPTPTPTPTPSSHDDRAVPATGVEVSDNSLLRFTSLSLSLLAATTYIIVKKKDN